LPEIYSSGSIKALFLKNLSYDSGSASILSQDLLGAIRKSNIFDVQRSQFGLKYIISDLIRATETAIVSLLHPGLLKPTYTSRLLRHISNYLVASRDSTIEALDTIVHTNNINFGNTPIEL
jgi:molybdopterin biosynthesis enzyme MoaB